MTRPRRNTVQLFALTVLIALSVGCGPAKQAEQQENTNTATAEADSQPSEPVGKSESKDDMKKMVAIAIAHHAIHKKGPSDWDSFIAFADENKSDAVDTLLALKDAGVVFYCEQEANKATNGQSQSIFAYYKTVPENGGVVSLMDGSIVEMSAEDFSKMLEVQTKFAPDNVAKKTE